MSILFSRIIFCENRLSHRFRMRCRAILLKSEHLSNAEMAQKLDVAVPSVFNRTKRYVAEGKAGQRTKPGQGRKPIMDWSDEALVREAVSRERQSVKAENVAEFIDDFSKTITRPTFLVLDNASVHTGGKMKESIDKWKERGLYIFFLPPYSPHLNIAETLWRVLKTKWLKPSHYIDTHTLFDTTHRILDGIGNMYAVNYSKVA